jgi:SAM-dependent methyltransferase
VLPSNSFRYAENLFFKSQEFFDMSAAAHPVWNTHHQLAVDLVSGSFQSDDVELQSLLGSCPACRGRASTAIIELPDVPVLSCQLWDDRSSARNAPTALMELVGCKQCGNIYNKKFNPELITYDHHYQNSLDYSATHRKYVSDLAEKLVRKLNLAGGEVIDIGAGEGVLLRAMGERFAVRGIGIDPGASDETRNFGSGGSLQLVNGFFATYPGPISSDLVICQHVLEHLPAPWALLRQIRDRHSPQSVRIYLEVPNGQLLYSPSGIWDVIYEHVSYFTEESLRYLAESEGFRVIESGLSYGDQYLWLLAESHNEGLLLSEKKAAADAPHVNHERTLARWHDTVRHWISTGTRVALWGAGAKGITFATLLDPECELFSLYDINPKKWNSHIPCSSHRIEPPHCLSSFRPDVVIVMNPLYTQEIKRTVHRMCPDARVIDVGEFENGGR